MKLLPLFVIARSQLVQTLNALNKPIIHNLSRSLRTISVHFSAPFASISNYYGISRQLEYFRKCFQLRLSKFVVERLSETEILSG